MIGGRLKRRFKTPAFICGPGDLRPGAIVRDTYDTFGREFMVMHVYAPQMGTNFGMHIRPLDDGPGEEYVSVPVNWERVG